MPQLKIVWGLNLLWLCVLALVVLAPYLASIGSPLAGFVYLMFKPLCHQLPQRSFFLFGHKLAVCARCTGVYLGLFVGGVFAALLLSFGAMQKPLGMGVFLVALAPAFVDGTTQLVGLRQSTNVLRLATGFLAGAAVSVTLYSRIFTHKPD